LFVVTVLLLLQFASTNTKIWNHYHHHCSKSTPSQTSKKIQPKQNTQRAVKRLEAGNKLATKPLAGNPFFFWQQQQQQNGGGHESHKEQHTIEKKT
jgi:hypothetical protein